MSQPYGFNSPAIPCAGAAGTRTAPIGTNPANTITGLSPFTALVATAQQTVAGVGGTSVQLYLQGSMDEANWFDIASFDTFVPADGVGPVTAISLSGAASATQATAKGSIDSVGARTIISSIIPNAMRVREKVVGTYSTPAQYIVSLLFK